MRVSPADYRENLTALGDFWERRDVRPLFVTLPTSHPRLGVPGYLIDNGFGSSEAAILAAHRDYNRIVREVAADRGWPLLDLETRLAALTEDDLRRVFLDDGIHLTARGLALVAQELAAAIASRCASEVPAADEIVC